MSAIVICAIVLVSALTAVIAAYNTAIELRDIAANIIHEIKKEQKYDEVSLMLLD